MKAIKYFSKYPECYVTIPELDEDKKPIEGKSKRLDGYYCGTVRDIVTKESFIQAFDIGLIYVKNEGSFLKVPLEAIHFGK